MDDDHSEAVCNSVSSTARLADEQAFNEQLSKIIIQKGKLITYLSLLYFLAAIVSIIYFLFA
jgi:hypothetical protein